ncbi:DUF6241 domain-containing protein [Bacillus sp. DX1.1]|uniref:DUF6241 domain-containing protein n=1 Tax=unclassified Bacillus (in: firmicutes) TaxID=185979 RepID=UPI002570E611|nr:MULTISPECIES: DUF6241 domain-containing protein [unclassified Bacillus (in: firmicutes)]MDM5157291.1 DUF6241 domain-containing protein [Bacillus sp. DX1.1]WJE81518.1 DUF6241 domain-containing protein [Bacillus sp. DX3.1]
MNRWVKTLLIIVVFFVGAAFIGYKVGAYLGYDDKENQIDAVKGEKIVFDLNSDRHIINAMHKMVHQKVLSHEKQGFIKMTSENIEEVRRMIDESNSGSLQHKEQYLKIFTRWDEGDFSQAVEEHNLLWEWGNTSNGSAYELATPEQEREYILEQAKYEK